MKLLALAIFLGLVFVGWAIMTASITRHRGVEDEEEPLGIRQARTHLFIIAAIFSVVLYGLSDHDAKKQDFAACKVKALEIYPGRHASTESEEEQAYYAMLCMEAAGYKVELHCLDPRGESYATARWILDSCYKRETWLGRLIVLIGTMRAAAPSN